VKRILLSLLFMAVAPLDAQMAHHHETGSPASATAVLIEQARQATQIFFDRPVAIAQGYRLVGRDLPMMGEHWLNVRLLVDGVMDVTRPQILTYLDIGEKPVLTGVVYAVALGKGESPPALFGPDAMWHEHNGSIDDEALVPEHHMEPSKAEGTRVAFLHVWTGVPFQENIFAAENWALPFVRAGISVPDRFSNYTARSVSLINGSAAYYMDMMGSRRDSATFDRYGAEVNAIVSPARGERRALTDEEMKKLDEIWTKLLRDVESTSGTEAMQKIKGKG